MEKQKTRSASQSRKGNSSEDAQPLTSNESYLPQQHHTPSEGSQGGQTITGAQGATLGEEHKQALSEVQGVRNTLYVYLGT